MPQQVFLLLGQGVVRGEYRKTLGGITLDKGIFPFSHLLAAPADNSAVVKTQLCVRNHQTFVYANHTAETSAFGAGAYRGIEREHLLAGLFEGDAVALKIRGERIKALFFAYTRCRKKMQHEDALPFIHGGTHGV